MKILMTLLVCLSSFTTYATEIANYKFGTQIDEMNYRIYNVSVQSDMKLNISYKAYLGDHWDINQDTEIDSQSFVKALTAIAFMNIKFLIVDLSDATIKTEENCFMCQVQPGATAANDHLSVARLYDSSSNSFNGPITLVDGPDECWVSQFVKPSDNIDYINAKKLKAMLGILILNDSFKG